MADGYTFYVDRTAIMLFASAVGETNKIYYDDGHAADTELGRVIAPPTFATAASQWDPSYGLRGVRQIPEPPTETAGVSEPEQEAEDEGGGRGGLGRGLHAEQHYHYHKPLAPGMKLTVTSKRGKRWEKEGRRGGKLYFGETVTEYRDEDGELVVTARSVGVQTSQVVEDRT